MRSWRAARQTSPSPPSPLPLGAEGNEEPSPVSLSPLGRGQGEGSVIDGFEAPAAAIARETAEGAIVELHIPLVLDEGRFRPPLARDAPRPRARDDPPREPGGA